MAVRFLSRAIELFGLHRESLTPTLKFWISTRVSYTHTEILDISTGLLHPYRNSGYLYGSLTPTQKFWISPRVSYTHTEILDISTGLLHPHRNFGYLHGSLTPTQKFWTSSQVSYTHTKFLCGCKRANCDASNPGGPLTTRQPTKYLCLIL